MNLSRSNKWTLHLLATALSTCTLMTLAPFLHTASDQKLEPGKAWERRIPRPLNCFQKQRVGYRVGQGFVSRNASRNTRGRVQGEVLLVPLISCSNETMSTFDWLHCKVICVIHQYVYSTLCTCTCTVSCSLHEELKTLLLHACYSLS